MKANFARCLDEVLKHEGGKVDHPKDPGGRTAYGVTQATYDAWRKKQGLSTRDVFKIERAEIEAIYRNEYWDKVKGDDLPPGVDLAVFDFAVNSGVSRAAKYTQRIVDVAQDGVIGPATLTAIRNYNGPLNIDLCDERLRFLRALSTWDTFGRGWSARVNSVRKVSEEMRKSTPPAPAPAPKPDPLIADLLSALSHPDVQDRIRQIVRTG